METVVDELLKVRANPRPAVLRIVQGPLTQRALPAIVAALGSVLAYFALDTRDLGLLASGAAAWSVGTCAAQARWSELGYRIHLTAGLLALALFRDATVAGEFVPATALLVVAALAALASTTDLRRTMAPMSVSVPWQFRDSYRRYTLRYGALGLGVGLLLVLFVPNPILKVVGVACVPMALRTFAIRLLRPERAAALWMVVALFQVAALAAFVPSHGAMAAAWIVVGTECMLLAGAATMIARGTGVSPFPMRTLTVGGGGALLVFAAAVPGTGLWPLLVTVVFAAVASIFLWPNRDARLKRATRS